MTQKNVIDSISDQTGVAITSRGSYIAPGKKPEGTGRRLHLLLEGDSDLQVKQAKLEILRQLEEETLKLGASSFGRYAVL